MARPRVLLAEDHPRVAELVPMQTYVGQFLQTFREYPPRQKAASFTVDQVMDSLTRSLGSK